MLRERFRKAWEYQEGTAKHPTDEMISIPNNATLISQLSTPLVEVAESGKLRIESKAKMRTRGVKSPDHADMLAYLFAPPPAGTWRTDSAALEALKNRYAKKKES